jgi:DNA-binding MarR family transcriptional regulator
MKSEEPFPGEDAKESTGFLLWQVTAVWQRQVSAALRPHELTQVQFALLASLLWLSGLQEWVTQANLARHAKLDEMMTSQVLRSLQKRGLVERHAHPHDSRAKHLELTADGRTKVFAALPDVGRVDSHFFSALGVRRKNFNQALHSLIAQDGASA